MTDYGHSMRKLNLPSVKPSDTYEKDKIKKNQCGLCRHNNTRTDRMKKL